MHHNKAKKWALVTGSSKGLGCELALELAVKGFNLIIHGRDTHLLQNVQTEIEKSKRDCLAIALDLTPDMATEKLHRIIKNKNISLSVLINNLGGGVIGDTRNISTEALRNSIRLNLEIGIELNNLFYDDLKANQGIICHIGSTASLHHDAPPGYVISKTALNGYIKNAARTFGSEGVTIFGILPGMLDHAESYINRCKQTNPLKYESFLTQSIQDRFTTSREAAMFTVSTINHGIPMINGALISFDGGRD